MENCSSEHRFLGHSSCSVTSMRCQRFFQRPFSTIEHQRQRNYRTSPLGELYRVLKPTGSLYLHSTPRQAIICGLLLDAVFGPSQFATRLSGGAPGVTARAAASTHPRHPALLQQNGGLFFRVTRAGHTCAPCDKAYRQESSGQYKFTSAANVLTAPGNERRLGKPWRGLIPPPRIVTGRAAVSCASRCPQHSPLRSSVCSNKLDALHEAGFIEIRRGAAWPVPVRHLKIDDGQPLPDIWSTSLTPRTRCMRAAKDRCDVAWLGPTDPPAAWPTRRKKPLGLLERIIRSSCPEGAPSSIRSAGPARL